jgi:hypothetical protein
VAGAATSERRYVRHSATSSTLSGSHPVSSLTKPGTRINALR